MFKPLGLLSGSRCTDEPCFRPYCFFGHSQATNGAGPSKSAARPMPVTASKRKHSLPDVGQDDEVAKKVKATRPENVTAQRPVKAVGLRESAATTSATVTLLSGHKPTNPNGGIIAQQPKPREVSGSVPVKDAAGTTVRSLPELRQSQSRAC